MSATQHSLPGACTCGRNRYVILIPPPPSSAAPNPASVLFGSSSDNRQAHSSPLPALLRIPLPWLHSTTYAHYADESHAAIRKSYTPPHAPHTKRHFCGFCGTPLTYWSEEGPEEAEMISVNLSNLRGESLGVLAAMGLLPTIADGEDGGADGERGDVRKREGEGEGVVEVRGQQWFEELIEGSELGRLRRKPGGQTSKDGKTRVEWEVVEWEVVESESDGTGDVEGGSGGGKRKHGDVGGEEGGEEGLPVREGY